MRRGRSFVFHFDLMPSSKDVDTSTGTEDLRRQILDTARSLLVSDGYQNLSMRKIARSIGYSPTSIYLHFESKDALIHALIHEGMMELRGELEDSAARGEGSPLERLRTLCRRFVEFGLTNPEYYEIMFQLRPERMERYPREKYREARENLNFFVEALVQGSEEGLFDVDDAQVSASAIWAALHGTISLLLAERIDARIDRDAFVDASIQQTIQGCLRTPVPSAPV